MFSWKGWLTESLSRRFTVFLAIVLSGASLAFLAIILAIYSQELAHERGQASKAVSLLLQASLENAMLKRDLDGLRMIVSRLGQQEGITNVAILNPEGEIRFASHDELIGQNASSLLMQACPACARPQSPPATVTRFVTDHQGRKVLRTFNPVKNRATCKQCHGPATTNPVNGVLVVDYDAAPIHRKARSGLIALSLAGTTVLLLASLATWWFLGRFVLQPTRELVKASRSLSAGDLQTSVDIPGVDEIARLGQAFNGMARRLKESHDQILRRHRFLQELIDADPDGVRVIDNNYRIAIANRAYCEQVGQSMDEVLKNRCYISSHGRDTPCPATLVTCPLHEIERSGQALKCLQSFLHPNGKTLQVEISAAPLPVDNGSRSLIVESIRDLEKAVEYSHEQKLSSIGQLAAGVAHEIHNPLASIRMALHASAKAARDNALVPGELENYLCLVNGKIDECIEVSNRLLKLGALPGAQPELVDVNQAVEETLSLLKHEGEQQGVHFKLDLAPVQPRIMAADGDLRMVVLNLAQNAFHAMPEGGNLRVATKVTNDHVDLLFEDTGIAIAADVLPRIFDPFFSRRANGKIGTGLGLTISRNLVERYGGQIQVSCARPQGTCFRVTFPNADSVGSRLAGNAQ